MIFRKREIHPVVLVVCAVIAVAFYLGAWYVGLRIQRWQICTFAECRR